MVILRLQINRDFNVSCAARVRDTWVQLCDTLKFYKSLFASHREVTLIEDLCGIETSNRQPRHNASLCSSFNRPQGKILTAGSDTQPNLLCSLVKNTFPCISSFSFFSPELFTICRLSTTCAVFKCVHTLQEEKYVGSELILLLTYREIPVVFNLDCGIQERYKEEKRMCFEQKCVWGVPYCFVAGILDNTGGNDKHII